MKPEHPTEIRFDCPNCKGFGCHFPEGSVVPESCPMCEGDGDVGLSAKLKDTFRRLTERKNHRFPVTCPECGGSGFKQYDDIPTGDFSTPACCYLCDKTGNVSFAEWIRFRLSRLKNKWTPARGNFG